MAGDWERFTADFPVGGAQTVTGNARLDRAIAGDGWQCSCLNGSIGNARATVNRRAVGSLEQRHAVVAGDREGPAVDSPVGDSCAVANRFVAGNARLDNAVAGDNGQYSGFDTSVGNARAGVNRCAVRSLEQRHATVAGDRAVFAPPVGGTRTVANWFVAAIARPDNAIAGADWPYCGLDTSVGSACVAVNRRAVGILEQRHAVVAGDRKNFALIGGTRAVAHRPPQVVPPSLPSGRRPNFGTDTRAGDHVESSLRAKRSNLSRHDETRLDCFVAVAPRNDGLVGDRTSSHLALGVRNAVRTLEIAIADTE